MDYSVIIPVYNSEASLEELAGWLVAVMDATGKSYEMIFIDDGSRDESWQVLNKLKALYQDKLTAIRLAKNFGQHSATFCGFNFAKGDFVITIDDDLQIPPEEIPKLMQAMEENDAELVYGIYRKKNHSYIRNLGSRAVKKISHLLGRPKEGSSFRLISSNIIQKIIIHHQNFVFIDEILHWYTDYVELVTVEHHPRKYKKSGYSMRRIWGLLANIMFYYTTVPLKVMVYGGLISSVFFFILSLIFALKKILFNVPLGYTSLIVAILLSTSLILLSLGVLGEYLSRIYMVQNKKPLYSVKKVL
ncbi:MAG: glycosyltransferase [Bacteroidales bacterium]|nr:glycosyltransferase [Bacteroidales bacterium]